MMTAAASNALNDEYKPVRIWLMTIITLVFAMVIVGGATRLTNSGLSITEWKPILGAIPPLGEQDWQEAFSKYKQIPEYKIENSGMSLSEFKFIYWWEWSHRFLGRFIGVVFFIPFLYFWLTGALKTTSLKLKLFALFILGGLQGGMGWYMVMSGLVDRTDVSQYRLAAHLGLAVFIMVCTYWVYMGLKSNPGQLMNRAKTGLATVTGAVLAVLVFLQILLGGLVAGIHAGKSHNTWPLMDGQFIPDGLGAMTPWYLNIFENAMTVQFDHRMLAYLIFFAAIFQVWLVATRMGEGRHLSSVVMLFLLILVQIGLGIWTLLAVVPLDLALIHQGGALFVMLMSTAHLYSLCHAREPGN